MAMKSINISAFSKIKSLENFVSTREKKPKKINVYSYITKLKMKIKINDN